MQSWLPSIVALLAFAVVATIVTLARTGLGDDPRSLKRAAVASAFAIAVQAGHFVEEAVTGLSRRLPDLFGLAPMSMRAFVTINVLALAIWAGSTWGLTHRRAWPLFFLWFLGVASVANAVFHPALALATGGYFPGLVTSPATGLAGVLLLARLTRITSARV